jgi:DNA invertase Pin-like site-specific DNA recombinase
MRMAAIYARVSSEQQREENTIASQTASLIEFAKNHELEAPKEWVFEDEGYSGATLERPGLERTQIPLLSTRCDACLTQRGVVPVVKCRQRPETEIGCNAPSSVA